MWVSNHVLIHVMTRKLEGLRAIFSGLGTSCAYSQVWDVRCIMKLAMNCCLYVRRQPYSQTRCKDWQMMISVVVHQLVSWHNATRELWNAVKNQLAFHCTGKSLWTWICGCEFTQTTWWCNKINKPDSSLHVASFGVKHILHRKTASCILDLQRNHIW